MTLPKAALALVTLYGAPRRYHAPPRTATGTRLNGAREAGARFEEGRAGRRRLVGRSCLSLAERERGAGASEAMSRDADAPWVGGIRDCAVRDTPATDHRRRRRLPRHCRQRPERRSETPRPPTTECEASAGISAKVATATRGITSENLLKIAPTGVVCLSAW